MGHTIATVSEIDRPDCARLSAPAPQIVGYGGRSLQRGGPVRSALKLLGLVCYVAEEGPDGPEPGHNA